MDTSSIEIVRLTFRWQEGLKFFFQDLKKSGDELYFSPHSTDETSIEQLFSSGGRDLYYLLVEEGKVLGYGMLRGWDEGYDIPSLGLAIRSSARGEGLGKLFMGFLHASALRRGACKVRLRVHRENNKAVSLYKSLGYDFEEDSMEIDYLVGFKDLQ